MEPRHRTDSDSFEHVPEPSSQREIRISDESDELDMMNGDNTAWTCSCSSPAQWLVPPPAVESSEIRTSDGSDESDMMDGDNAAWACSCSSLTRYLALSPAVKSGEVRSAASDWSRENIDCSDSVDGLRFSDPPSVNPTSDSSWEDMESHRNTYSKHGRDNSSGGGNDGSSENNEYLCGRVCKHEAYTGVRCPKKRLEERAQNLSGGESDDSEYMCGGRVCKHEAVTGVRCPTWARIPRKKTKATLEDPIRKPGMAPTESGVLNLLAQLMRGRESRRAAKVEEIRDMAEYLRDLANEFADEWETAIDVLAGVDNLERIMGYMEKRSLEGRSSGLLEKGKGRAATITGPLEPEYKFKSI